VSVNKPPSVGRLYTGTLNLPTDFHSQWSVGQLLLLLSAAVPTELLGKKRLLGFGAYGIIIVELTNFHDVKYDKLYNKKVNTVRRKAVKL